LPKFKRLSYALAGLALAFLACSGLVAGAREAAIGNDSSASQLSQTGSSGLAQDVAGPEAEKATLTDTIQGDAARQAELAELLASLPPRGRAPELDNEVWLNSEPLSLTELRGKVVLVEFWTFG
jgi:hypothetical protein